MQPDMARSKVVGVFGVLVSWADVLEAVARQSRTVMELAGGLPVSRSAVDHGLRELERADSIEARDAVRYSVLTGRMALETYLQFVGCLNNTDAAAAALDTLDSDAPLAPAFPDDCEAVPVADGGPGSTFPKLAFFVEKAGSVCGCVRKTFPSQVDAYYRVVADDGTPVDTVATGDMVQCLITVY